MHNAVRSGQKKHNHDTYGDDEDNDTAELKLKQRQAKRDEKQLKGPVGVGPQFTCGSPIVSAPLIQRE